MTRREARFHNGKAGSALTVRVTPRASRNRIHAIMEDGTVKIQLTAAPVDGEANARLIIFLSKILRISKSRIEIVAGATGKDKLISVLGLDPAMLHDRILAALH